MRLIFIDSNPLIVKCWERHYQTCLKLLNQYNLTLIQACNFEFHSTTIENFIKHHQIGNGQTSVVTPTNALSYMGGGFDKHLLLGLLLGTKVTDYKYLENIIQNRQLNQFHGYLIPNHIYKLDLLELSVSGTYNYKDTLAYKNLNLVEMIQIPTMVIPEKIDHSHIFEAIWSLVTHLKKDKTRKVDNLIIPGLGTGYGKLNEYDSTKIMILAIFLYNLNLSNLRLNQLKKSIMILFFFNKDYKMFRNQSDLSELERDVISEYGRNIEMKSGTIMELEELFKCVQL